MTDTATQAGLAPTRKLTTMLIGVPALTLLLGPAVAEVWPQIAPVWATGAAVTALVTTLPGVIISGVLAYFGVPDKPNVPSTGA